MKLGNPSGHNVLHILWRPRVSWLEDEGHAGYSWFLLPILICWMLKGCPCSLLDGCCHKDSHLWMFGYFQENLGVLVLDSCILFYFCLFKESHNWLSMINLISKKNIYKKWLFKTETRTTCHNKALPFGTSPWLS